MRPYPRDNKPRDENLPLELERSTINFVKKLGAGSFGEVWQAKMAAQGNKVTTVAVKKLLANQESLKETQGFLEEAKRMHKLNHPKVVRLLGVVSKEAPVLIVTEFMENGSLYDYLLGAFDKHYNQALTFKVQIYMMAQVKDSIP